MDFYELCDTRTESIREYSKEERPVDIGKWVSYMPYHEEEQLHLQRENLLALPVSNTYGQICFIFSKNIDNFERYLEDVSKEVRVENTEVVLETEVFYTSKIEGAKTTRRRTSEIHNGSPVQEDNKFSESMVKGNFEAVKMLNLYGNKINETILLKVWDVLTRDCRENEEIMGEKYRIGEVTVTNSDFKAVPPSQVEEKMREFITFYDSPLLDDKPFVKAVILHFTFETIHPFSDGNGRLGRLLINNYLISRGVESCRAVSFSEQIDKNRGAYDAAFSDSENEYSDCTPFLEYMLDIMSRAFYTAAHIKRE